MKIYFSGSIRGGRDDQKYYFEIIRFLAGYGKVLTEHIGRADLTAFGESLPENEIFDRDMRWLEEADVVVAEVTRPSIGVGYEIALAEKMGKPVLCLYRPSENARVSLIISANPKLELATYLDLSEIPPLLEKFFAHART